MTTTLQLDFDKRWSLCNFRKWAASAAVALDVMKLTPLKCQVGDTRKGHHVRIIVRENLADMEIVAAQAVLGSDRGREALNFRRVRQGASNWNVLYVTKGLYDDKGNETAGYVETPNDPFTAILGSRLLTGVRIGRKNRGPPPVTKLD